jgi:hypothetical protein
MKKALLFSAIAALLFFSCKKNHSASTGPSGKKYPVTFNVTNFITSHGGFAIRHGANNLSDTVSVASSGADLLYYLVYDQFGKTVHNFPTVQDSTNANFGTVTDSLPAGSYQVVFVAGKKGLQVTGAGQTASAIFGYGGTKWQDAFWDGINVTVGANGVSQDVTLKRVVGKLEVDITDAIPANADSLEINVNPESDSRQITDGLPNGQPAGVVDYREKIPASAIGTTNFTMDRLIGNTAIPFTVVITARDASNAVIGSATVNNVSVTSNMKTILSGNLFGGTPPANSQTFTVKVDTAWNSTTTQVNFGLRKH